MIKPSNIVLKFANRSWDYVQFQGYICSRFTARRSNSL